MLVVQILERLRRTGRLASLARLCLYLLALSMAPGVRAATIFTQDFSEGGVVADYETGGSSADTLFDDIGDKDGAGPGTGYTQSIDSNTLKLEAASSESGGQGFKYNHSSTLTLSTFDLQWNINRTNGDFDFAPAMEFQIGDGSVGSNDFDDGIAAVNAWVDVTLRVTGADYQIENNGETTNNNPVELTYGNDVDLRFLLNDGSTSLFYTGPDSSIYILENENLAMFYNDGGGGWTVGWDNLTGRGNALGNTPTIEDFRVTETKENFTANFDDFLWTDTIDTPTNDVWTQNGNGNWGDNANWSGSFPDATGKVAEFSNNGGAITADPTVTLTANRTISGILIEDRAYTITGNTIIMDNTGTANAVILIQESATATIASNITLNDDLVIHNDTSNTATISGVIANGTSGTNVTIDGTGTVEFTNTSDHTYTGTFTVNEGTTILNASALNVVRADLVINDGGTVRLDRDNQIRDSGTVTVNDGGTLNFNNQNDTFDDLNGAGTITLGSGQLSIGNDNGSGDFSGTISGTWKVRKVGTGTQVLSGTAANTHTGDYDVVAGTLTLSKTDGVDAIADLGTDVVSISSGATLLLGASNQINDAADMSLDGGTFSTAGFDETLGNLTLTANSIIDLGTGTGSHVKFSGTVSGIGTGAGEYSLSVYNWSGDPYGGGLDVDSLIFTSSLDADALSAITFYKDAGTTLWSSHDEIMQEASGSVMPVPEPSTWLSGFGLFSLCVGWQWRRRKKS